VVQTFNFALIPERNRVVFVGLASFIWTAYLSFMEASSS
jgi:Mpv17 / PMP22 family